MNYAEISKETIGYLYKSYNSLKQSPLDQTLRVLIELRVSQMNGCEYCCTLHANEAKQMGIAQDKINTLEKWPQSSAFSKTEMAALAWAESLTLRDKNMGHHKEQLAKHYNEREIVDITACISIMNALNRLATSLRE